MTDTKIYEDTEKEICDECGAIVKVEAGSTWAKAHPKHDKPEAELKAEDKAQAKHEKEQEKDDTKKAAEAGESKTTGTPKPTTASTATSSYRETK